MAIWIGILVAFLIVSIWASIRIDSSFVGAVIIVLAIFLIVLFTGISNYSTAVDYTISPSPTITHDITIENAQNIIDAQKRNDWIARAKIQRTKWGVFSLYPESVLKLQESPWVK